MLKKTVESVFGDPNAPSHGYVVSGVAKFLELDVDKIRKDLGVDESAVLRGQQNLPRPDDDALDDTQRAIIKDIESYRKQATDGYDGEMKTYESRLAALSFLSNATEITEAAKTAEGDFVELVHHTILELNELKDRRDRAIADLAGFRELNRLRHEPRLSKIHPFLFYMILFFILAAETVMNGMFFAERVSGGLAQGFTEALLFALVNVVFGYLSGRTATGTIHIKPGIRTLAFIALAILVSGIAVNNLFAAHYRSVLTDDVELMEAAALAWDHLKADIFGISDIKSWQLMGLGWLAATFSALDGWKKDEPYPGYGDKARTRNRAVEDFIAAKQSRLEDVTTAHTKASDTIKANLKRLEGGLVQYRALIEYRRKFHDAYVEYVEHLERVANDLLTSYRQKNRETRTDNSAPAYFKTPFKFSRSEVAPPSDQSETLASAAEIVRDATARLNGQLDTLHAARIKTMADMAAIG